jgi:hypothetical protein
MSDYTFRNWIQTTLPFLREEEGKLIQEEKKVANVILGKIEIAAEDVLRFLSVTQTAILKGPAVLSALATLIGGLDKVVVDIQVDAANPLQLLNVPFTMQQLADIKAVLPEIKATLTAAGYKFTA